jgi:hypothetical protein
MQPLASVFAFSLLALSLFACESSPPVVDDVREDAADRDAGPDAQDGAADD